MDHGPHGTQSAGPLTGAGIGLVLAAVLCWGLYRRVLSINLTRFFTATGAVLIVIAAGVLGYGLRDLQEGGVLPGGAAYAVNLSGSVNAGSWYSTLLQGVLNLTPTMTWLQVAGYAGYLGVVMTLFVRGVRGAAPALSPSPTRPAPGTPAPSGPAPATSAPSGPASVTPAPTGAAPATGTPALAAPRTAEPATPAPSGPASVTPAPTGAAPATGTPALAAPRTAEPATPAPSGPASVTPAPTGAAPVTRTAEPATSAPSGPAPATPAPSGPQPRPAKAPSPKHTPAPTRHRPAWLIPVAVVAVPAILAGLVVALARPKPAGGETVAVSAKNCGQGFTAPEPGRQTFQMRNTGDQTSEVYLIDPGTNAVYGEIEGLAPGTTRDLVATVAGGTYAWRCVPTDGKAVTSRAVRVAGAAGARAVAPVSAKDLAGPLRAYKAYVDRGLATLVTETRTLGDDIRSGHLDRARADWLTAHRTYAALGAAYGTFEDFDQKINGRPDGLPGGVHDKDFTGFHRIEYGLWHGRPAGELKGPAGQLAADVAGLRKAFPHQDFDPSDLPLRAHEILENTLQFELTGDTDQGSGTGLATAEANLAGTRELLTVLRPLLTTRAPHLLPTVDADSARLRTLLDAQHRDGRWTPVDRLGRTAKDRIDGATGQLLEDLSPVPDLLEIRKSA
ncbi:hypothetical protein SAFG77S_04286 [Streptomyces afghaniensis]